MKSRLAAAVGVLALAGLVATACGGDDDDDAASNTTATTAPSNGDATTTTAGSGSGSGDESADALAPKPLAERTSVTITPAVAIEPFAPIYIADAFGEFDKENLDVTITPLAPADGYVAVARGDAQVQVGGINAGFLNAVNAGTELRWVASVHHTGPDSKEGLWVRNEFIHDGEVSADDMKTMQIAIGAGGITSTSALPVSVWAEAQGVHLNQLQLQPLGGNDIAIALDNGSIGAGYVLSPQWIQTEESGCCTLVTPLPALSASTYTMSEDFIQDEPEVAEAIMRAIGRTVRTYLQGDYHSDDEVMNKMAEEFGVPVDGIRQTPSLQFDPDMGLDLDVIQDLQQVWIDNDILEFDEPLPLDRLTDTSPVDAVLADG